MLASVIISFLYLAVCCGAFWYLKKHGGIKIPKWCVWGAVGLAAGLRVFLAMQNYHFTYDINCFKAWGNYSRELGFGGLYSGDFFLDYPPGYMYILSLLDAVHDMLGLGYDAALSTFVFKLPAMIADFGCAYIVYRFAKEKADQTTATFLGLAVLFAPSVVFVSSVWGQIESWYIFFILLSLYFAYHNKTVFTAIAYAVALITKPQSLLFGPVLLFYIVKGKSVKELFKALGTGFASVYILALPFSKGLFDVMWLVDLYRGTIAGYENFTVNGFNLYYFLGLNWTSLDNVAGATSINFIVISLVLCMTALIVLCNKELSGLFSAAAVSIAVMFAFCTMMHERYIYPTVLLCVMAYIARNRKGYLVFGGIISCLNYINSSWVMSMYYQTFPLDSTAEKAVSLVTTITVLAFAAFALWDTLKDGAIDMKKLNKPKYIVALITVVYAFFALNMLGSTKAPQTFWQSTDQDFSFRVHFDQPTEIGKIYVYSGLGDQFSEPVGQKLCGEFQVFASENGTDFDYLWDITDQSVYSWKEYSVDITASTILVQAKRAGSVLGEIIILDKDGNVVEGTLDAINAGNPYGAEFALDEQDTKPYGTTYYNSMYFDEIYHGRTAYEQINGYYIYETTHPPLGKILISLGIRIFGMTPFGWRIVGAVCGIAMIPVMYLLALTLTSSSLCGIFAAAITACDFMHITQTRIATVDTYVVLFALLTFLFMARYHKSEFGDRKAEWTNLLLSGAFMGCSIASKWNGAYPMVGLAVFFFVSLLFKFNASGKTAKDKKYLTNTILFCFLAFVAVPIVIYAVSFIPVIDAECFKGYLTQLWGYQEHMYNYHSQLEAEHFFSSMWYTWPFSIKPIWYAITDSNGMVSTISAFGNPIVWVVTPFASLYCLYQGIRRKKLFHLFVALGWLSSYLPWVMVTRLCFIYHYFPCAMFGIVAMAMMATDAVNRWPEFKKYMWVYIALCAVLFVIFLPVTTGITAPKAYIEALEIMPQWYFVN